MKSIVVITVTVIILSAAVVAIYMAFKVPLPQPSVHHYIAGGIHYAVLPGCPAPVNVTQDSIQNAIVMRALLIQEAAEHLEARKGYRRRR